MMELRATLPCPSPPAWAVLERHLFSLLDQSVHPYLEKYTRPDGSPWRIGVRHPRHIGMIVEIDGARSAGRDDIALQAGLREDQNLGRDRDAEIAQDRFKVAEPRLEL